MPAGFTTTLTSFTFASWVKLDALKNATRFFDLGIGADATNNFLAFVPSYSSDNGYMCVRYRPASGTAYNVISKTKCPVNAWAHVAFTYDWNGTSGTGTIYLNGANVGSVSNLPYNPSLSLGAATENYLGFSRWGQDTNGFGGTFDDVRFYNRALTATDVLTLNGLSELNSQYAALSLSDLNNVTTDITLPTTLGSKGVTVRWASSNPAIIDTLGHVTRPEKFDISVKLTATLTQIVSGKVYTMTKEFNAKVIGIIPTPEQVAEWDFSADHITYENDTLRVTDIHSGLKGKLVNEARIRTIGNTERYNVLDLGNGTGYFDMGQEIGKVIYTLADHTIMGYFRIDEGYTNLAASGNYYWNFSNSDKVGTDMNGFMYGRLNGQAAGLSAAGSPSTATNYNTAASIGAWHHFAYTLNGTTGTVFVDGVQVAQNTAMLLPSNTLPKPNMSGTICNWLGRSGWASDAYLQQTLLYDFQLLSIPLSSEDINLLFQVPETIEKLNNAYTENPDYIATELQTEVDNLTLGNISALTSNISLPSKGTLDQTITISWKSSNTAIISTSGDVVRPDYFPYNVTLTATLLKNGQSTSKTFAATVLAKDGSQFNNDLLVRYDFSQVNDTVVTDVAEKGFKGELRNGARVHTIGTTKKFNVLELGDSIGYFDMGPEIGKLIYNLNDYSIGAYYRIDTAYHELASNGNFLFSLSNTNNAMTDQSGYIIGSLKDQSLSITPKYYTAATGNQAVSFATPALQGNWHHLLYTQNGTVGTLYVDGTAVQVSDITNLPATTLPKSGRMGTIYNWIGRSNYTGDVYLRKTKVYDFRLYRKALTDMEIMVDLLNVGNTIGELEQAYSEDPTSVKTFEQSQFKVISKNGEIHISGLTGRDNVSIFDVTGRRLTSKNTSVYKLNAGVYIVRINEYATKVIVK